MHDMIDNLGTDAYRIVTGNSVAMLPSFADCSFDSCVCDPPYELGFMGKAWDKTGIAYNVELWREVYRVLKPGAYLLAFGGSRTYHRMACAIEDAGFEIRDQIQWIYGSGFPKSLDVSKAIDKMNGAEREVIGTKHTSTMSKAERDIPVDGMMFQISAPSSDDAKTWDGWGTALKPAHEPIVMARKPLEKGLTVAQNVLKWGTGAINIDGCRVEFEDAADAAVRFAASRVRGTVKQSVSIGKESRNGTNNYDPTKLAGRFPANVIHDGSDEVEAEFAKAGTRTSGVLAPHHSPLRIKDGNIYGKYNGRETDQTFGGDSGSASRFFYSPKASKYDREAGLPAAGTGVGALRDGNRERTLPNRNHHPTVKPTDLMQYLCRMVTPPGGLILDPFLGSGSTMKAALIERFRCVGIELNPEYAEIAEARLKTLQVKLF